MADAAALSPGASPPRTGSQYGVPFTGGAWVLMIVLVSLSNLMEVLDITIANVSINTIAGALGVSITEGTWMVTSYAVANAVTVPLAGFLAQRFGQVKVFSLALVGFTVASMLCGFATSLAMLITGRIIQGGFAGLMIPLSQALMLGNSPPRLRTMALATWGMTITVGPILGPLLGGWITSNFHWSWIFLINVPTGLLVSFAVWTLLKSRETPMTAPPVDTIGIVLVVIWVAALQILFDKGNELAWFESNTVIGLAAVAFMGFCFFIAWELTVDHPLVDLRLFLHRNFLVGMVVLGMGFCVYFANIVLLPIMLQSSLGYNSDWAGRILAPGGIFAVLLSPVIGRLTGRVDPRIFVTCGFIIFAICSYWRADYTMNSSVLQLAMPQIFVGIGTAMFFAPVIGILTGGIPLHLLPRATTLQNFCRMMLASFGSAIIVTSWDHRAIFHRTHLVEVLPAQSPRLLDGMTALQQSGASDMIAYGQIDRMIEAQAGLMSANDIFVISAIIYLLCLGIVWFARPPFVPGAGGR